MTKYAKTLLPIELHLQVTELSKIEEVSDQQAADCLAVGRQLVRDVDTSFKAVTADTKAVLDKFSAERSSLKGKVEAVVDRMEVQVKDAIKEGRLPPKMETSNGVKIASIPKRDVSITDVEKVPRKYMMLVPDMDALREAYKDAIHGTGEAPKIAGTELFVGMMLRTQLPNVVED